MLTGKKITLLKGGPGSEREVSLASAKGVAAALREAGAEVTEVDVKNGSFNLPAGADVVFNVIHGTFGEDGVVQRILEERGACYTGAGSRSSETAFDKLASKALFVKHGVPTPAYQVLPMPATPDEVTLPLPVCIKPPREGSSVGVHLVTKAEQLKEALDDCAKYDTHALIEPLITGKELTVGILGEEALPIVHIQPRSGFYDINNKYPWMNNTGATDYFCPAELSAATTQRVQEAALAAHRSLGVEVYSRVDVLLDADETPWVLEVNTIPGMTASSLLPKAALVAGLSFPALCARIVDLSLSVTR